MPDKPVALFAFAANDLDGVGKEADLIWSYASETDQVDAQKLEQTTVIDLADAVFDADENLFMIHFGGHADGGNIVLDGFLDMDKVRLSRMLLPRNHNVQLMFLNGCLTAGHVGLLTAKNVKAIIATNVRIDDREAAQIGRYFYRLFFKQHHPLKEAFERAESVVRGANSYTTIVNPGEFDENQSLPSDWSLFVHAGHTQAMDWTLGQFLEDMKGDDEQQPADQTYSRLKPLPDEVRNLVARGEIEQALDALMNLARSARRENEVIQLTARWNQLKRDRISGILTQQQISMRQAQITQAILGVLEIM